ncbi:MAG: apolipoprotein N-acyltransferase [Deltaproteobacteria bacterium]|nr:apolipoprotein N-acyltransferase [Deltaproteobacteria bacterium]
MKLPRPEPKRVLLAGLSAVGMVLSCPNYDQFWLGFVMWIPYFAAIEGLSARRAFRYGWLVGIITVFWGFFWMSQLLVKFADFSVPAATPVTFLFALWHGLLWGLSALVITKLRARVDWPLWIVAPAVWVGVEATLPNIFPIYMAHAWCWQPLLIQTADLGGVTMVSGIMVATNAALYTLLRARLDAKPIARRDVIAAVTLLVGNPIYGALRLAQLHAAIDDAPTVRFGVVQGNMSIRQMAHPEWRRWVLDNEQQMTAALEAQGAEVALWGETAYHNPRAFTRDRTTDLPPDHPWRVKRGFDIPIIFGAVTRESQGGSPYPYNSAILLDRAGTVAGRYDKVYRLMFGEYAPLVSPEWYLKQVPSASHIAQGAGPGVLPLGPWRLGPFVCYEDILPRYVRETAAQEVNAFVNLTNDAWFGKTEEPGQHLGLAVFRAVEHRKPMVRAVNTGVSVYIDPTGAAHHRTEVTDPDIDGPQPPDGFVVDVPMMDPQHRTIYGYTGELFDAICVGLVVFMWTRRRRDAGTAAAAAVG